MAALTLVRAYQHLFDSHPNTTLAITGGCLNALGDVVAQVTQNVVCRSRQFLHLLFIYAKHSLEKTEANGDAMTLHGRLGFSALGSR